MTELVKTRNVKLQFGEIYDMLLVAHTTSMIQRPMVKLGDLTFKWAAPQSRNFMAVYVLYRQEYLGKFYENRPLDWRPIEIDASLVELLRSYANMTRSQLIETLEIQGKRTGICGCCGRLLTNEGSIARGIGPICAGRYGI